MSENLNCAICGLEIIDCDGHDYIGTEVDQCCTFHVHKRGKSHVGKLPYKHFATLDKENPMGMCGKNSQPKGGE